MKTVSVKLPDDLADRIEALKQKTGISESALLRQATQAGIGAVEQGLALIHKASGLPEVEPAA